MLHRDFKICRNGRTMSREEYEGIVSACRGSVAGGKLEGAVGCSSRKRNGSRRFSRRGRRCARESKSSASESTSTMLETYPIFKIS